MFEPGAGQAASARAVKAIGTDGRETLIQEGVVLFAIRDSAGVHLGD